MVYAKQYLDGVQQIRQTDTNDQIITGLQGTLAGSAIGAIVGVMIAHGKGYNKLWCGFAGALAGGVVSRAFQPPKS